jgi:hypothetical protein
MLGFAPPASSQAGLAHAQLSTVGCRLGARAHWYLDTLVFTCVAWRQPLSQLFWPVDSYSSQSSAWVAGSLLEGEPFDSGGHEKSSTVGREAAESRGKRPVKLGVSNHEEGVWFGGKG